MKILKIQIRSAQNVGKVWIGPKKTFLAPFGAIPSIFSMDRKYPKIGICLQFSLVGQWALFTQFGVMCWCHVQLLLEVNPLLHRGLKRFILSEHSAIRSKGFLGLQ